MKKEDKFKFVVWILSSCLFIACCAVGYLAYQNLWWKKTMNIMADQVGVSQAMSAFRLGHLVLWVVEGENENSRSSGRKDGPFEIWIDEYHSHMPGPWRYAQQRGNEAHNRQMRYMYEHPARFKSFEDDTDSSKTNLPSQLNRD